MEYRNDVYEIQTWLRRVFRGREDVTPIIPSGIYTKETADAVRIFQRERGMTETGVVDYETWCAAKDAFAALEKACAPVFPFPSTECVLRQGERCDTVMMCQMMLAAISVAYDCFPDVEINGMLDQNTAEYVKTFQKINRIEPTGSIDLETWNALARSYNVFANNGSFTG